MDLENVTAALRPRGPWESADFGARLIRRDAAAIYRIWFAVTLPLMLLALLATAYSPYPTFAAFLYWWLEPVADGPMLHVISRRLFGEQPNVREALRATLSLAWRNCVFLLSPYRFHIARSIAMPVTQLEGMSGKARRARAKVLNPKIMRYGTGLTIAYQHLFLALYFGVILLGYALVPPEYRDTIGSDWVTQFWEGEGRSAAILSLLIAYCAQSALQPWFVGAGFGLYINCRTLLEAWDLEIAFRRIAQRRSARAVAASLVAALVLSPLLLGPGPTMAQERDLNKDKTEQRDPGFPWYWGDDVLEPALETVMSSDALQTTRETELWRRIDREERAQDREPSALGEWLRGLGRAMSLLLELGLWIAVVGLVVAVIIWARDWLPAVGVVPRTARPPHRVVLADGEITAESLPDDIPGEALRLCRDGESRRALSLLYRGSVYYAVSRYGIRLPPSATEGICITAVAQQAEPAQAAFFRKLVTAWTWCAYGSRDPSEDLVVHLCAEWPRYYATSA